MAAKSKKVEKARSKSKVVKTTVHLGSGRESKLADYAEGRVEPEKVTHEVVEGTGIGDGCEADKSMTAAEAAAIDREAAAFVAEDALAPASPPPVLTLPLLTDSATLFIQGAQQLTAQLLGTPESAVMLVNVNGWLKKFGEIKKLITGNDDEIAGLKKLVVETGQPWGEKGSKQLTLAGAVVKVKAISYREVGAPLTINDLDAEKVEAYLRGVQWTQPIEKVLACYMKPVTSWVLKDLPPQQQTNLLKMLNDPGEDGQGLRQCVKETKYQMMAPEMEGA